MFVGRRIFAIRPYYIPYSRHPRLHHSCFVGYKIELFGFWFLGFRYVLACSGCVCRCVIGRVCFSRFAGRVSDGRWCEVDESSSRTREAEGARNSPGGRSPSAPKGASPSWTPSGTARHPSGCHFADELRSNTHHINFILLFVYNLTL